MKVIDSLKNEVKKRIENDSAHDFEHTIRVYKNAQKICKKEKANEKLVLSAALLHDLVSYPKSDKRSKTSSIESAKKSKKILEKLGFSKEEIIIILDAIYLSKTKVWLKYISRSLVIQFPKYRH